MTYPLHLWWTLSFLYVKCQLAVADSGFSTGDANPRQGCANLLFGKFFAEYCMEMKEFRSHMTTTMCFFFCRHVRTLVKKANHL